MKKLYEEITDEELAALTGAIKTRYGIDFTRYERKSLKRGFARLMGKHDMDSLLDLWGVILKDADFFKKCIDDLTVNLTELFRNPEIWEKLEEVLDTFKFTPKINIWHAGCASGEEVYSMAMVLQKKGLLNKTRLLGTDISSVALAKAMKAWYPKALMPKYENSLKKYLPNGSFHSMFNEVDGHAEVKEELRKIADFRYHNLVSDKMNEKFDIIFCRNVMIYFDDDLKMNVLKSLLSSLNEDGFFILGYYDMLPERSRELLKQYDSNTRIYTSKPYLKQLG